MDMTHGPGYCSKCNNALLTVNDVRTCIYCDAKKPVSGNASTVEDPGEEGLGILLEHKGQEMQRIPISKVSSGTLEDAIRIVKSLPLPEDVKQFKRVKKIIDLMEQLRG